MSADKLFKQFIEGDKNAINELYSQYSKRLYRFAFGYLKTESDAQDIVQEVFVRLWNNRDKLKKDSNIEAYIFTIAKNTIISVFRKKISEKEFLEDLKFKVVKNSSDTEVQVDYSILSEKVKSTIDQLPPQRKKIYLLSKEKGLTNQKIADELNISVKTVEDHITKARKFLKGNLKDYGFVALLFYELFISQF